MKHLRVTVPQVMAMHPCGSPGSYNPGPYTEGYVRSLFGRRKYMTALQALDLDISDEDKLWAVLRPELIDEVTRRLLACDFAERALKRERKAGREPDERSWNAIRVSRRYARGKATKDALDAAWAAAWAAAWDAAKAAAWDAAGAAAWAAAKAAAGDAAKAAAWDAAKAAERKWQIKRVRKYLEAA